MACSGEDSDGADEVHWKGASPILEPELAPPDSPRAASCIPGEARRCFCHDGSAGSQICKDSGARLGPCTCAGSGLGTTASQRQPERRPKPEATVEVEPSTIDSSQESAKAEAVQEPPEEHYSPPTSSKVDKVIDHGIDYVTPESSGATRDMQREAVKFMLDPRPGQSGQHLENLMEAAERAGRGE